MKKAIAILAMLIISVMSVAATTLHITPQNTNMPITGEKLVSACITTVNQAGETIPMPGLALSVTKTCIDVNHNTMCDNNDLPVSPSKFWVTVESSPTDEEGCGSLMLHTSEANDGDYSYEVNGISEGGVVVENGAAYIPEMGIFGAVAVLALAGLFIAKRR